MAANSGDEKKSLISTASSETLVSIGASATPVSRQHSHPIKDSFYERTTTEDDEVSALDQWLHISLPRGNHDDPPLGVSHRTNCGVFQHRFGSRTSRFEDQDAIPHPSHRNVRTIAVKAPPLYTPATEHATVMSAVHVQNEEQSMYNLVVLGDRGVGKRSFTIQASMLHGHYELGLTSIQFIMKGFIKPDNQAIEKSTYYRQAVIDEVPCTVGVMGTAGMEELPNLLEERIRQADAFLLMYSIWSRSSFEQIRELHSQIREMKEESRGPILIFEN